MPPVCEWYIHIRIHKLKLCENMVHYSVIMLTTKDARTGAPIEVEKGIWFNAVHRQQDGIYILRYVHVKNIVTEYHCLTFYQLFVFEL